MPERRWRVLLTRRYPAFFDWPNGHRRANAIFPFIHGDGWGILLWRTLRALRQLQQETGVQTTIRDVQEKWGSLCIHYTTTGESMSGHRMAEQIIANAEQLSDMTCELCGRPGHLSRVGWWRTLCPLCAAMDGRDRGASQRD